MDTIVLCAVFRDAARSILDWIAFHRLIGVARFVLYDLGSTDATAGLVARSRFGRQALVIYWPRSDEPATAYVDFAANHANRFTRAAVIDPGEFIHSLAADTMRPLLRRCDGFSAVLLRRLTFGIRGHPIRAGQLVIANNTSRLPDSVPLNGVAPTPLRTADLSGVRGTPPAFTVAGDTCDARSGRVPVQGQPAEACDDVMVVNRYLRGVEAEATVQDRHITSFVPRLPAMLHDVPLAVQPRGLPLPPIQDTPAPSVTAVPLLLGIGIITYNRRSVLSETLDRVQQHTRHPRTIVAVADDGSTDGTLEMLRERQVLTVSGRNMSIAWNKNRALFLLSELLRCDVVILLEDDAYPSRDGWEAEWMHAAIRWGHANVATEWLREHFLSGSGTVEDPIHSQWLTAQCTVFSREALLFGGYFDTRFRGYGHEHIEHTRRLVRLGYGGTEQPVNGQPGPVFKLLWGGLSYHLVPSMFEGREEQKERNRLLAQALSGDFSYRAAWQNEDEARQFRDEMRHSSPRAVL